MHGDRARGHPAGRAGERRTLWALRLLERAKLSPRYPWIYETVTEDSFVSIDRVRQQLGWQPRYSEEGRARAQQLRLVLRQRGSAGQRGVTHRVPQGGKQGALALAKLAFPARD